MKTLLLAATLILFGSFTHHPKTDDTVYVCISPTAKKYHFKKSCPGLQRCSHEIKPMTKAEATKSGYTVCLKE